MGSVGYRYLGITVIVVKHPLRPVYKTSIFSSPKYKSFNKVKTWGYELTSVGNASDISEYQV